MRAPESQAAGRDSGTAGLPGLWSWGFGYAGTVAAIGLFVQGIADLFDLYLLIIVGESGLQFILVGGHFGYTGDPGENVANSRRTRGSGHSWDIDGDLDRSGQGASRQRQGNGETS